MMSAWCEEIAMPVIIQFLFLTLRRNVLYHVTVLECKKFEEYISSTSSELSTARARVVELENSAEKLFIFGDKQLEEKSREIENLRNMLEAASEGKSVEELADLAAAGLREEMAVLREKLKILCEAGIASGAVQPNGHGVGALWVGGAAYGVGVGAFLSVGGAAFQGGPDGGLDVVSGGGHGAGVADLGGGPRRVGRTTDTAKLFPARQEGSSGPHPLVTRRDDAANSSSSSSSSSGTRQLPAPRQVVARGGTAPAVGAPARQFFPPLTLQQPVLPMAYGGTEAFNRRQRRFDEIAAAAAAAAATIGFFDTTRSEREGGK